MTPPSGAPAEQPLAGLIDRPIDTLLDGLALEQIELTIFRGKSPPTPTQRIFGGLVAGQSLVAAGRTVEPDRPVHSLHAYFLRPGDPSIPVVYEVDRIRDGRSFATRRVVAVQRGEAIFHLSASFQRHEDGLDHAEHAPDVPRPEGLRGVVEVMAEHDPGAPVGFMAHHPVDVRYVGIPPFLRTEPSDEPIPIWMRVDGRLPDDPLLHVCAVTYASDLLLLDAAVAVHGIALGSGRIRLASLDHAMWFHRPFRADEWFLYVQHSPSTSGGRGLATGRIYGPDGRLAVSVVQEGVVRTERPGP